MWQPQRTHPQGRQGPSVLIYFSLLFWRGWCHSRVSHKEPEVFLAPLIDNLANGPLNPNNFLLLLSSICMMWRWFRSATISYLTVFSVSYCNLHVCALILAWDFLNWEWWVVWEILHRKQYQENNLVIIKPLTNLGKPCFISFCYLILLLNHRSLHL